MSNYILCDVGNPFPSRHVTSFVLVTQLEDIHQIDDTELVFGFSIASNYAEDLNALDNTYNRMYHIIYYTAVFTKCITCPNIHHIHRCTCCWVYYIHSVSNPYILLYVVYLGLYIYIFAMFYFVSLLITDIFTAPNFHENLSLIYLNMHPVLY